jgi:hypothetical protein
MTAAQTRMLVNFLAFQIGWFACVIGGARDMPWLGPLVVALVIGYHLRIAQRPAGELWLIAVAAGLGLVWDSALVAGGLLSYPSGTLVAGTAPYWIVAMWMLFATTLNVSMRWLHGRYALAAVLGAIAGPLAYYGGAKLGGVVFEDMTLGLGALAVGWAVFMPALMAVAARLDGINRPVVATA